MAKDYTDFKEYTRLRDIVHKRNARLAEAGLAPLVHFPTVKEIKAGYVSPAEAFNAIQNYYSGGSTVKAVRQTGLAPEIRQYPVMPTPKKLTPEEKKARRREQAREYRQRKLIKKYSGSSEEAKKNLSYLKALQTMARKYKENGLDFGLDLSSLSPHDAMAFVDYINYRFAQADFENEYVIDKFMQGFSNMLKKGYKPEDIVKDFEKFLLDYAELEAREATMEGLNKDQVMAIWEKYTEII